MSKIALKKTDVSSVWSCHASPRNFSFTVHYKNVTIAYDSYSTFFTFDLAHHIQFEEDFRKLQSPRSDLIRVALNIQIKKQKTKNLHWKNKEVTGATVSPLQPW